MRLQSVYTRFYRAFNYDYLRDSDPSATQNPWDVLPDGNVRHYIQARIDSELTCIVGANEAGKSQLLDAIQFAFGTKAPDEADFCRYSDYFTVTEAPRHPDFGVQFGNLTETEAQELSGLLDDTPVIPAGSSFHLFRPAQQRVDIYLDGTPHSVSNVDALDALLPRVVTLEPDLALPNSVPIAYLASGAAEQGIPRQTWRRVVGPALNNSTDIISLLNNPPQLVKRLEALYGMSENTNSAFSHGSQQNEQMKLAFDLLVTVGEIDTGTFGSLQTALEREDEGLATGITSAINNQLAKRLNLAKWWSQDSDFRLAVAVREFDLVFTIQDRTGSSYSFGERSGGLKYFLSYLVQSLAHMKHRTANEILLMDEPDAYLSNQGQQDLLRLLKEFTASTPAVPDGSQVVFVTHSPFLIDKNRADRIRVLDKGAGDEGVRVVRDVGHNRFEPLRTAMGSFVGETIFMGNCNIIVEGIADQVLLAGMSSLLGTRGVDPDERLDLNNVTLVPAGGASNVPYMAYLARGRGVEKPAVVVLLDGDKAGDDAAAEIEKVLPDGKRLLDPKYIIQITRDSIAGLESEWDSGPLELEDLIPLDVALAAIKSYADDIGFTNFDGEQVRPDAKSHLAESSSAGVFAALTHALTLTQEPRLRLEKFPFAKHVVEVSTRPEAFDLSKTSVDTICNRFAILFRYLTEHQRQADRERERKSIEQRVNREIAQFVGDQRSLNKMGLKRLLERIEGVVDEDEAGDELATEIRRLRDSYQLNRDLNEPIDDIAVLKSRLKELVYAERRSSQEPDHQNP